MSFNQADVLILTEVYPAGEDPIPGINGQALFEAVQEYGHKNVLYEPEMNRLPEIVSRLIEPGDMILVLGAGNISRIIPEIIQRLEAELKK
jgi:UDP-N-acetylmuramate--alanine ligase